MEKTASHRRLAAVTFLFFLFSFLGWAMEKIFVYVVSGVNADRGFLALPFCTMYGFGMVIARLMLGSPVADIGYPWNVLRLVGYILFAAFLCTAAELITGIFFEQVVGVCLWSYEGAPHTYLGYVCLPVSVAWGLLLPVVMQGIWLPLEARLERTRGAWLPAINTLLTLALSADFLLSLLL